MTDIYTIKGDKYSFDPDTERIFKNGILLTTIQAEPVYARATKSEIPRFAGIYLKEIDSILSISGKINPITDANVVQ